MQDITKLFRASDRSCISSFLVHGGDFPPGFERVSANVGDGNGVGFNLIDLVEYLMDVPKTGAMLKMLGCEGHVRWKCAVDAVNGKDGRWSERKRLKCCIGRIDVIG